MMAPEVWMCDGLRKTNKVDIFCSGMTLLEYVFGTDAFVLMSQYNKRNADTGALFTPDQLRGKLTRHFKKFWNEPKSAEMIELLVGMTETDPNERLSAEEWLHHPALKDVSDPLEVADDVPVSDASSPPQDNVEQLKVNLEAAKHRVADAEEKTAGLKTENAELKGGHNFACMSGTVPLLPELTFLHTCYQHLSIHLARSSTSKAMEHTELFS